MSVGCGEGVEKGLEVNLLPLHPFNPSKRYIQKITIHRNIYLYTKMVGKLKKTLYIERNENRRFILIMENKQKTETIDYFECERCNHSSENIENLMCPCPRGSCEAEFMGKVIITRKIIKTNAN